MADEKTNADSLRLYRTTDRGAGAGQPDPLDSLGGHASTDEAVSLQWLRRQAISNVRIEFVAGANGEGEGALIATGDSQLTWTPPSGSVGSPVTIANGETKVIEGNDADKYLRVTRTSSTALAGSESVELTVPKFNLFGGARVGETDRAAGNDTYLAAMIRNDNANTITSVSVYLRALGDEVTQDGGQLSASGAGTVTTTGTFATWPQRGFAARFDSVSGNIEEWCYYESRTDTVLTVPAGGRDVYSDSPSDGGDSSDTWIPYSPVEVGLKAPSDGALERVANTTTAPSGVTFGHGVTHADGETKASLTTGEEIGIWVRRVVLAAMQGDAFTEVDLLLDFDDDGATSRQQILSGAFDIEEDAREQYELYASTGRGTAVDYSSPVATNATVPFNHSLASSTVHNLTLRKRNKYNQLRENIDVITVEADGSGEQNPEPPTAPEVTVETVEGGKLKFTGTYTPAADDNDADEAVLWYETDGTAPDPDNDTAKDTVTLTTGPFRTWEYTTSAFLDNTDVKWIWRTRNTTNSVDSVNTSVTTTTVDRIGPARVGGSVQIGSRESVFVAPRVPDSDDNQVIDAGESLRFVVDGDSVSFYWDTILIWRVFAPRESHGFGELYIPSTFSIDQQTSMPAGGTSDVIEVISASPKRLGINVNGTREMWIDATNKIINWNGGYTQQADPVSVPEPTPIFARADATVFQVWNYGDADWDTWSELESGGTWKLKVMLKQQNTQAEIEALT